MLGTREDGWADKGGGERGKWGNKIDTFPVVDGQKPEKRAINVRGGRGPV